MFLEVQHHGCPLQLCVDMTLVELEHDRAGSLFPLTSSNHSHGNRDLLCARCHAKYSPYFITLLSLGRKHGCSEAVAAPADSAGGQWPPDSVSLV